MSSRIAWFINGGDWNVQARGQQPAPKRDLFRRLIEETWRGRQPQSSSRLLGISPKVFKTVVSPKLPMFGSPVRLNASVPA
jgi:hypothetical protein